MVSADQALSFNASTEASVNLIGSDSDSTSTPGQAISSSFSAGGASANASADSDLKLSTFATSSSFSPINPAGSTSVYNVNYSIVGNSAGVILPLTFNFSLTGDLHADPGPSGDGRSGVASAGFQYLIISPAGNIGGNAVATFQVFGNRFIPSTTASGFLPGIPLGINTLGIDTTFNLNIPVLTQTETTGFLTSSLVSSASSTQSNGANATSDFSNGLSLTSITVPADFNSVNLDNLFVVFDSGRTIKVTSDGNGNTSVPEPSSTLGLLAALSAFVTRSVLKRKEKGRC